MCRLGLADRPHSAAGCRHTQAVWKGAVSGGSHLHPASGHKEPVTGLSDTEHRLGGERVSVCVCVCVLGNCQGCSAIVTHHSLHTHKHTHTCGFRPWQK